MATSTSNLPAQQQPIDTYARLAHLLHSPAPDREALLDQLYQELLTRESRAYAAGWTDALTEARRTRTGQAWPASRRTQYALDHFCRPGGVVSRGTGTPVRRRRRLGMIGLAVIAPLVGLAVALGALGGNTERVTGMWVGAEIAKDGSARVTEVIDYDFGDGLETRHGIYRDIPGLSDLESEAEVHTTMDSAPIPYELTVTDDWDSDTNRIRVGDPDDTVTGIHRYRIQYTLPKVVRGGKLAWDAVGTGWKVDLDHVEVHVVAPFGLTGTRCVEGATGSQQKCAAAEPGPGRLDVAIGKLGPGEGATLYAGAERRLDGTATLPTAPSGAAEGTTHVSWWVPGLLGAAVVLCTGLAVARLLRFAGRERVAADGGEMRVDAERLAASLTPASSPPEELTPAQGGILSAERVTSAHKVAWLMSTALDGHLTIDGDGYHPPTLIRRRGAPSVHNDPAVRPVLREIFSGRNRLTLGSYDSQFAAAWRTLTEKLTEWQDTSGLWDPAGRRRFRVTRWAGAGAVLLGLVSAVTGGVLSGGTGSAWQTVLPAGAAVTGAGLAMVIRAWELQVRTPRGTALWMRVESFRRFLAESGPYGIDTPDGTDDEEDARLGRYTAWAVALDNIDHWSRRATESTATPASERPTRASTRTSPYGPAIARALVTSTSTSTTPPSSSGSDSGSSGGSSSGGVGGGTGGGGGGSW